jgi:hypothetical protein
VELLESIDSSDWKGTLKALQDRQSFQVFRDSYSNSFSPLLSPFCFLFGVFFRFSKAIDVIAAVENEHFLALRSLAGPEELLPLSP